MLKRWWKSGEQRRADKRLVRLAMNPGEAMYPLFLLWQQFGRTDKIDELNAALDRLQKRGKS